MMILKPKQALALNKSYLKVKPTRDQIKLFKDNLIKLIDETNLDKREELHKNDFSDFLKDTYYKTSNYINIKDTIDLVVHSSIDPQSPVSILIEAKSPTNKTEMISTNSINTKSMQELMLYYLRERISNNNINLKHLIITNRYEWFIFDAALFEKLFAQNKQLVNQFNDFENKTLSVTKTKDFYSEIAKPAIELIKEKIEYIYFDIREYKKHLDNNTIEDDNKLIPLYKIFSPEHLLKLPIANDNNTLDKSFYSELLHIIGLEETKQGGKKIITRKELGRRDIGSLLENCITELDNGDKLSAITNIEQYGANTEERLFNVALELVIIWINRILFLKLLEGQLISFNKSSKDYAFLSSDIIKGYDDLNNLFFGVLAKQHHDRSDANQKQFAKIPYLNSSLFDPQSEKLEKECFAISALNYNRTLRIDAKTVLKDRAGKKDTGEKNTLEYLFEFLNSYNFASDSSDEIQEDSKTIINAAVLGLIFEKINGYKDGSFYTPSFITMYMCRETIRRAVVEKFNQAKSWNCQTFDELYNKIEDRHDANNIINSITICDPAVGSGHFLVSALNEIIAIKSELRILQDHAGNRLKEYQVQIVNDELIVTDEDGDLFAYNPSNKESQRIQTALFHEKQTIIENCLFGVDINPNSVKICRLRLWIELLKNTYYKNRENHELETLPNIDINIKCGNSLISRYKLTDDISSALKSLKHSNNKEITVDFYRKVVNQYKNAKTREGKKDLNLLIAKIKLEFSSGLWQASLFDDDANQKHEMEMFYIQQNAFEWRFEFPEILADDGAFIGFDVVIGNPPYISALNMKRDTVTKQYFKNKFAQISGTYDIYVLFVELIGYISHSASVYSYIIPNKFLVAQYAKNSLSNMKKSNSIEYSIDLSKHNVFEEAAVYPIIIFGKINDSKTFRNLMVNNLEEFIKENILNEIKPLKAFKTLKDYGILIQSGLAGFQAESIKPYLSEESNSHNIDFIVSGCVDRFSYMNKNVRYMGMKYESCFIDINCPLSSEKLSFWTNPKIVIAGMTKNIEAVYIEKPMGLGVGVYGIYNLEQDIFYLLVAILNSKFISYYFKVKFKDKTLSGGYLAINKNTIQDIPFVDIDDDKKEQLILLSKKINDNNSDHSSLLIIELEKQIDQLVYELYGLTDDEIKIIEAN